MTVITSCSSSPSPSLLNNSENNVNNNNNNNTNNDLASPPSCSHHQQQQQNKRVSDIIERERRQHAVETSQMESEIEILSTKIDQLQDELERAHQHYQRTCQEREKEEAQRKPSQQHELLLARQQLAELSDTCGGLQKARREEGKRSIQLIADLEKQVATLQDTNALREMEIERLEGAIASLVDLHISETQKAIFEHEAKTEFAQKCLLLHEKTYPHALLVENHQLREKLFAAQCQSDEREKSLALAQQKLRDAKEQLQISDSEASSFVAKLKTCKEWRALTLAAGDETAAAVKVIADLFEQRKQSLTQQEDAQATRYRMLELRLGEEVVARRQKNVQSVVAPDEADKLLQSHQNQLKGMEEIVLRKNLQKKLESYYCNYSDGSSIAAAQAGVTNAVATQLASTFSSPVGKMKHDISQRIISKALEKGKPIPAKELKNFLGITSY